MAEWHFYSDTDHAWRRQISSVRPNERQSTHEASESCHKLCREGYWPLPPELRAKAAAGHPGIGPFGFRRGEYADSWTEMIDGRRFYLIRWPNSIGYGELRYEFHNPYSHIPGMENSPKVWGWIGIQSRHESLRGAY